MLLALLAWLLFAHAIAHGEQLPLKTYTTADGLAQDNVNKIVRDSRGFLWLCTGEGLSRFDGYQFVTYTTDQGLSHRVVNDFLETRAGVYWVATGNGVCRFNPRATPLFTVFRPGTDSRLWAVESLVEDSAGVVWLGTETGLYRLDEPGGQPRLQFVDIGTPADAEGNFIEALLVDRQGALWVGTRGSGLYQRSPNGRVNRYTSRNGLPANRIDAMLQDRSGRLWIGTPDGLCVFAQDPDPNKQIVQRYYGAEEGLVGKWISSLFQSADGHLWVGMHGGLAELVSGESLEPSAPAKAAKIQPVHFRSYGTASGLSAADVETITEDYDRNLWLGTESGGAMKLVPGGFRTYTQQDGLCSAGVDAVVQDRAGRLCAINRDCISWFDGQRFSTVPFLLPKRMRPGWGWNQVAFQDRDGEWWVPTGRGLCRFPEVGVEELASTPPKSVYNTANGLPFDEVFRLFEDRKGDIWISTLSRGNNGLSRWERATQKFETFSESLELGDLRSRAVAAFAEDAAGNVWIGYWGGGLARYSAGRFEVFGEVDGLPAGTIRAIYLDHGHRLWIASALGGLGRIDDPMASRPRFADYTAAQGLSSNDTWCVTEDQFGRIYVGTGRGLDRLDPDTGHIRHYTIADGLAKGQIRSAFTDSHGALWFAGNVGGLSRLVPGPDSPEIEPPILISGLRIAGVPYPLSQLGETRLTELDLGPDQNQLNIDFVGLSFGSGEVLRYQHRLEGADADWSPPSTDRIVNYEHLAPGHYRFMVRAVNAEGLASGTPAALAFTIPPPVWRRWWVLASAMLLIGLGIFAAHRSRVARLVEIERVRTRIATDLHDDIGANLSLIAMVSEVARGHFQREDQRLKEWFSTIAITSRDTVDAMADIVWAVNPKRDQLSDLTMRMRRFADDIFDARSIELEFEGPEPGRDLKVGADLRREVFLIFKESVNNIVRHSGASAAQVDLHVDRGWLVLQITDNGHGFDPNVAADGNGLSSMRQRASRLGGSFEVASGNRGTTSVLRVPLRNS
jgi:ligand-binding sensor domain-containing protein/two-component sensor histidine kinase